MFKIFFYIKRNPCLHRSVQEKRLFNYSELSGLTYAYNKKYQHTVVHIWKTEFKINVGNNSIFSIFPMYGRQKTNLRTKICLGILHRYYVEFFIHKKIKSYFFNLFLINYERIPTYSNLLCKCGRIIFEIC